MEVVQNQVQTLGHALCVVVMVKSDLAKVFLLFSKHVPNVRELVNKLLILAVIVVDKEKNKPQKDYLWLSLKVWMMAQE